MPVITNTPVEVTRHPAVAAVLRYFDYGHLPQGRLRTTSQQVYRLAHDMADNLGEGPELTVGLRKLLEAKDAFVRAALDA